MPDRAAAHDFGATLQFGTVAAVDDAKHAVRVRLPQLEGLETDWLPVLTQASGGNRFYSLPDVGELAVCLLDAQGESGVVLGTVYNEADPPPAADRNIWRKVFANGTVIEHNRSNGNVLVKSSGVVTIDADAVVKKTLTVQGLLSYTAGMSGSGGGAAAATIAGSLHATGDVKAGNISLQGHVHPDTTSGGKTGTPE